MEKHAKELIDGTHFLMKAGHAKKGVIAIKVVNDKLARNFRRRLKDIRI